MLKGFKTVLIGLVMVIVPPALHYMQAVDWSFLPSWAGIAASGVVMMVMRFFTTTPIASKD